MEEIFIQFAENMLCMDDVTANDGQTVFEHYNWVLTDTEQSYRCEKQLNFCIQM